MLRPLFICVYHSANEHVGDSLNTDGCMFALHTWSLLIHQCKQEVKVAQTSVFSIDCVHFVHAGILEYASCCPQFPKHEQNPVFVCFSYT